MLEKVPPESVRESRVASFPVEIHEPPLMRLCRSSNVGVEKSS